jgi:hypothetical protein
LFFVSGGGLHALVRRFAKRSRRHRNRGLVLGRLAQFAMILIGLLIALVIAIPGFMPGQLISVLGLGSVAIGFAFRDILENFLAGILIRLTEPFRVNDQIIYKEFEGTVEDIQTRATYIKTYDGRRVVIPNHGRRARELYELRSRRDRSALPDGAAQPEPSRARDERLEGVAHRAIGHIPGEQIAKRRHVLPFHAVPVAHGIAAVERGFGFLQRRLPE